MVRSLFNHVEIVFNHVGSVFKHVEIRVQTIDSCFGLFDIAG